MSEHPGSSRIDITPPLGGFDRRGVASAIEQAGLPELLESHADSFFGQSSRTLATLEALLDAVDLGGGAARALEGAIIEDLSGDERQASFRTPELGRNHRALVAAFQITVVADSFNRSVSSLCSLPLVEGSLESDGLDELLEETRHGLDLTRRILPLARGYVESRLSELPRKAPGRDDIAAQSLAAFLTLLQNACRDHITAGGATRALNRALENRRIEISGLTYAGLAQDNRSVASSGLLPVRSEDIVGNEAMLEAGLRLARDVAGYDFESAKNPKRFNPVLFALGPPGCGKTVTAHAIGNEFLRHCEDRKVPARFEVIRRTDWASSYQNASAANLVSLFRERVHGFDGVCGVYWPDIDTALASRGHGDLRVEEQQNLGAVFGVFDGTLIPRDGKWFLICDANTMHMDEAAISRITQQPVSVAGPETPDQFVKLLRDILLSDLCPHMPESKEAWQQIGERAVALGLSGRNIESAAGRIRTRIQDFDYPDRYFQSGPDEKAEIVASLGNDVSELEVLAVLEELAAFRAQTEQAETERRFEQEVEQIVRYLGASAEAQRRAEADKT